VENGKANAAVQHSSRGSQLLGMAGSRVTAVCISVKETASSCNKQTKESVITKEGNMK